MTATEAATRAAAGRTAGRTAATTAAKALSLAAAPCFAAMALATAAGVDSMICAPGRSAFAYDGMAAMYLLMAVFHLPPWLRRL